MLVHRLPQLGVLVVGDPDAVARVEREDDQQVDVRHGLGRRRAQAGHQVRSRGAPPEVRQRLEVGEEVDGSALGHDIGAG